jgi:cytosine/adenosine deaminase-related metal-dependent hydrolase
MTKGAELSRAGGTAIVGDIGGGQSLVPLEVLRRERLAGVNFLEVFGLGHRQPRAVEFLRQIAGDVAPAIDGVQLGLQPHAPYSCGREVYQAAADLNLPVSTHLAETREELDFVAHATGPLRDMLISIGVWDDSIKSHGLHPVDALADVLRSRPWIVAHLNCIEDRHLAMLAHWPITVAYCPRASAYFGHEGHWYRQMIEAGVRVAIGTDSILCLDTPDRISVLDEMRLLYRRDATDPLTLLRMATTNGAHALGFDPQVVSLGPGRISGVLGVRIDPTSDTDPLIQALTNNQSPEWIVGPMQSEELWISS